MRASYYRQISQWLVLIGIVCLVGCGGSEVNTPSDFVSTAPDAELVWPPQGQAVRMTSDDTLGVPGADASSKSGGAQVDGTTLILSAVNEPTDYAYGIYIIDGLGPVQDIGGVHVAFEINHITPDDDTALFVGISDYDSGVWEWYEVSGTGWNWATVQPDKYTSGTGKFAVACVATGVGECVINGVDFDRLGGVIIPPKPTGLTLEVLFPTTTPVVRLDWDDMGEELTYNIQRSSQADFSNKIQVNSEPVTTSNYDDTSVIGNRNYYFRVTSVVVAESVPSDSVFVRTPQLDLPAPTNIRVTDSGVDFFSVEWDWGEEPVSYFHTLLGVTPDFPVGSEVDERSSLGWGTKQATFDELAPGQSYWVRIYAEYSSFDGRISDAIPASTEPLWDFSGVEVLGPGLVPCAVIAADGDLSAAYVNDNKVMMARRDNGIWTTYDTNLNAVDAGYGYHVDIAYANEQHIIAFGNGDLYASFGNPGGIWSTEFVDNGTSGTHQAPVAGIGCKVNANETEVTITHMDHWSANGESVEYPERGLTHTRLWSDGIWQENVYSLGYPSKVYADSSVLVDGNLYVLSLDLKTFDFKFGDRTSGYTWEDIYEGSSEYYGVFNDLMYQDGVWHAAAYDQDNKSLDYLSNDGTGWQIELIAPAIATTKMGLFCKIDQRNGEPFIVFNSVLPERTYFATIYDGEWVVQQVVLADGNPYTKSEVVGLGTDVYILFKDRDDDLIKCTKVTPPPTTT